jgi:hypothetical protein
MSRGFVEVSVTIGEDCVTLYEAGRTAAIVAKLLGREVREGYETLWLDRIVHRANFQFTENWQASGAISTILTRPAPAPSPPTQ